MWSYFAFYSFLLVQHALCLNKYYTWITIEHSVFILTYPWWCRFSNTLNRFWVCLQTVPVWTTNHCPFNHSKTLKTRLRYTCRSNFHSFFSFFFSHSLLPWLQLDGDVLYLSQAADIGAYHLRGAEGGKFQHNRVAVFSGHQEDVCRFTLTDAHVVSAGG